MARPVEVPEHEPVVKPPRAKRSRPPAKPPKPEPNPDASAPQVECILGPSKCKPVSPSLPATPTTTQIREAVAVVKEQAKACGPRHGATAGTKVKVKFAVSGETGRVLVAEAMPPFGGTPLGNCVAAALAKAQFPKFQNESLGVVYPILVDGT